MSWLQIKEYKILLCFINYHVWGDDDPIAVRKALNNLLIIFQFCFISEPIVPTDLFYRSSSDRSSRETAFSSPSLLWKRNCISKDSVTSALIVIKIFLAMPLSEPPLPQSEDWTWSRFILTTWSSPFLTTVPSINV